MFHYCCGTIFVFLMFIGKMIYLVVKAIRNIFSYIVLRSAILIKQDLGWVTLREKHAFFI